MVDSVVPLAGGDWSVVIGSRVGLDSANDGGSCLDWAQCNVARCHLCCCVVLLVFFLHFKSDVDAVSVFEGGIIVVNEPTIFEESKVLEAKDFGSLFFVLLDFDILARMHGKEKGKNGELRYSTLQLRQFPFCNFGNEAGGDGFLLLFFGVGIFEGSELSVENEAKLEVVVLGWVGSAVFLEGRRYIRDGILDCSQSQGVMSWSRKSSLTESHGKSSNDLVLLRSREGVKEDAVADAVGFEIPGETVPGPSVVLVCASRNYSFTGSFCSNKVSHKLILLGNDTI